MSSSKDKIERYGYKVEAVIDIVDNFSWNKENKIRKIKFITLK